MEFLQALRHSPNFSDLVASLALLLAVLLGRALAVRALGRSHFNVEVRRRWIGYIRTATLVFFLLGLIVIWAQQVRAVAISLLAVAVAVAIATKELILCLSGSVLRASARAFSVGDFIEVEGVRGEVVDVGALSTTILEVGPGPGSQLRTGRSIVIPNSVFLAKPVYNETITEDYVLHLLTAPLQPGDDWQRAEQALLSAAREECAAFIVEARQHMERLAAEQHLEPPRVDPLVYLRLTEHGVVLLLRFPTPSRSRVRVEQAILRRFLSRYPGAAGAGEPA